MRLVLAAALVLGVFAVLGGAVAQIDDDLSFMMTPAQLQAQLMRADSKLGEAPVLGSDPLGAVPQETMPNFIPQALHNHPDEFMLALDRLPGNDMRFAEQRVEAEASAQAEATQTAEAQAQAQADAQAESTAQQQVQAEQKSPLVTTTIVKREGKTTTTTTIVHPPKAGEESSEAGAHEGSEESSEGGAHEGGAAHDHERRHIITTTTTTVVRKVVPIDLSSGDEAGAEESSAAPKAAATDKAAQAEEEAKEQKEAQANAEEDAADESAEAEAAAEESKASKCAKKHHGKKVDAGKIHLNIEVIPKDGEDEDDCEDLEDPELKEKKARLTALQHQLAQKEREYQSEHDWMSKAISLIRTLHEKSGNVRLHLNDMHKDMMQIHEQEKMVEQQVHDMELEEQTNKKLSRLQSSMQQLMENAQSTKAEMATLASKRNLYLGKIDELKGMLDEIKAQSIAHRAKHNPMSLSVKSLGCPCHLPEEDRDCSCM